MKRFFLTRHGLSLANTRNLKINDPYIFDGDIPLTEQGKQQALESGQYLNQYFQEYNFDKRNTIMWVSPFLRTQQTADLMNKSLNLDKERIFEDPRLSEMDFGLFDQRDSRDCIEIDERIQKHLEALTTSARGKFYARRPNGESPSDVYNRISSFTETVYRDPEENMIIVSHGITLRTLTMRLLHENVEWYFHEKNAENCSIRLVEPGNNKINKYIYKPNSR